jgi:tetratricopeptide (TPR) repeat protein
MLRSGYDWRLVGPCLVAAAWLHVATAAALSAKSGAEGAAPGQPQEVGEEAIATLIDQLGAEDFARRERAEAELRRLGLLAFDALHQAQYNEDIEISLRSRYLLRSMAIRWFRDDDPLETKELLRGYEDKPADERRNLMEQLAKLPEHQGLAALCRLARFESSNTLSKRAALLVMQQPPASEAAVSTRIAELIRREVGLSQREAAEWLRTYVGTLAQAGDSFDAWERIRRHEEDLFQKTPEKTSLDIVRDLLRWEAELLERLQRHEQAQAMISRTIDLVDGTREQLGEMVAWLMERKTWGAVEELAKRFPERFGESALLLYPLAEAQLQQGRKAQAEETAQRALGIKAQAPQEHIEAAFHLQERGLFEWAEREYRLVIQLGPAGGQYELRARFLLSEMLHDQQREQDAAQVLQVVVDGMDRDQNVLQMVTRIGREAESIRSRMYYFWSEHHKSTGDIAKQIEQLRQGIKQDPTDADVLIAMYRVPAPDEGWREETLKLIREAGQQFREQIQECEQQAAEAPIEEARSLYHRQLATALNQFAWLIANTEGDYDHALRCSQRSLELVPNTSGYLDTLGRCCFAKQDYENAVKNQARAVELEPHSGQIRRQLEFFKQALAARKEADRKPSSSSPENR